MIIGFAMGFHAEHSQSHESHDGKRRSCRMVWSYWAYQRYIWLEVATYLMIRFSLVFRQYVHYRPVFTSIPKMITSPGLDLPLRDWTGDQTDKSIALLSQTLTRQAGQTTTCTQFVRYGWAERTSRALPCLEKVHLHSKPQGPD